MIRVFNNFSIIERNSFHVDVAARELIEYSSTEDLISIFSGDGMAPPASWLLLSGGNNILFTKDVERVILTPTADQITILSEDERSVKVRVEAAAEWDDVVEWAVSRELWGIENLSLIPGKAGAAPIQNIGAYGVEVCDVIQEVEYFDPRTLKTERIKGTECQFGYRDSIFKRELKGVVIVTAIIIELSKVATPKLNYADVTARVEGRGGATLRNIRDVICEIREEKLPDPAKLGNAGSFFKNPVVSIEKLEYLQKIYPTMPNYEVKEDETKRKLAAGWLIDQVGMKGYREGAVGVHTKQALVLVNYGGGSGAEVVALARKIQGVVKERFDVEIDCEVNII
ncbi:MAG: UDP-N-acetylmuramate dehydrogenase [Rikenellaceae bacterium]